MARRLAAIMFTDLVGSTKAAQEDERAALQRQIEQEELLRPIFAQYEGREVKSTGDGFIVAFESALRATECAVGAQRALGVRNARRPANPLLVRIGIHLGDVEWRNGDIFGDAANIASRIDRWAEPSGICLTEPVFAQVHNKVPYRFEKLRARALKGVKGRMNLYRVTVSEEAPGAPPVNAGPPRLAVLPFTNISPDPKDDYFADGLTEELITVLSRIRGLRVLSRTSVNQYKGTAKPIRQIGAELGADSVLEGSVRKAGDQLRIAVQLIDARTDDHRWSQTYDRKLENIFAVQAEVAERTAGALQVELFRQEKDAIAARPTASLVAYEAFLRGIRAAEQHATGSFQESTEEPIRYLEAAIREDPRFEAAHAALANFLIGQMGESRPAKETLPRARALAGRALELNPRSSDAHTARGNIAMQGDLDWTRAEAEFQEAISLNPSDAYARFWYGGLLRTLLRYEESEQQFRSTVELSPLWLLPRLSLALGPASARGDLASSLAAFEKLSREYPSSQPVRTSLARLSALMGRAEDAKRWLEPFADLTDIGSRSTRAATLAILGETEELRGMLREWKEGRRTEYVPLTTAAQAYALLGEDAAAMDLLEQDFREGDRAFWFVYQYPLFDGVRDDPRFVALLRAMNLPTSLPRPRLFPTHPPPAP